MHESSNRRQQIISLRNSAKFPGQSQALQRFIRIQPIVTTVACAIHVRQTTGYWCEVLGVGSMSSEVDIVVPASSCLVLVSVVLDLLDAGRR